MTKKGNTEEEIYQRKIKVSSPVQLSRNKKLKVLKYGGCDSYVGLKMNNLEHPLQNLIDISQVVFSPNTMKLSTLFHDNTMAK